MAKEPNFVFVFARCNLRLTSVTACGTLSQCQRFAGVVTSFSTGLATTLLGTCTSIVTESLLLNGTWTTGGR
jgi:hypothetical protein